jgi:hypothetical protein
MSHDIGDAKHGQRAEPEQHDRPEKRTDRPRAAPLDT